MSQAFNWFVNTVCKLLGYENDTNIQCKNAGPGVATDGEITKKGSQMMNDCGFQMPLHYPRYSKADYENMEERKVDMILREYGLMNFQGTLQQKRAYAMGTFLWPGQY